jgi:hypothetical protein
MSSTHVLRSLTVLLASLVLSVQCTTARADGCCSWWSRFQAGSLKSHCMTTHGPCLHCKWACVKSICDPYCLEHFGYYPTCWQPWPFPPDYRHCYALCMAPPLGAPAAMPAPSGTGASPAGPMPRADQLPKASTGLGLELPPPRPNK